MSAGASSATPPSEETNSEEPGNATLRTGKEQKARQKELKEKQSSSQADHQSTFLKEDSDEDKKEQFLSRDSSIDSLSSYGLEENPNDSSGYNQRKSKAKGIRGKMRSMFKTSETSEARNDRKQAYKDLQLKDRVVFGMHGGPSSSV